MMPTHSGTMTLDLKGLLELGSSAAILLVAAHGWIQFFAGIMLFGLGKGIIALITGEYPYAPHGSFPRFESGELAALSLVTLLLLVRFRNTPPVIFDRVALTAYVFVFWWLNIIRTPVAVLWIGLVPLFAAWLLHHWKGKYKSDRNASEMK